MIRRYIQIGCFIIAGFWFAAASAGAGMITVSFNNQDKRFTLPTMNEGATEFVHLSRIAELFGLELDIDPGDGHVVLGAEGDSASFFPGQRSVIVHRRTHFLDTPPRSVEGVIMVPLEFLSNILPLIYVDDIVWDAAQRTLSVGTHRSLEITDLYSSPYGDYTRIAISMSQVVSYKTTEKLPSMLIIELPNSQFHLAQNPLVIDSPSARQVKLVNSFGTTQILIRLGPDFVRYTHRIIEDPPRLIIDLYNSQEQHVESRVSENIVEEDLTDPQAGQQLPTLQRAFSLRTVVIDPGHGGSDQGILVVPGHDGIPDLFEKQLTLHIAQLLSTRLTQRLGVRTVLTREGDDFVSHETRTTIANSNRADIFISIHVNNSSVRTLSGFEAYVMDYGGLDISERANEINAQSQLLDYAQARYVKQSERLAAQVLSAYRSRNPGQRAVMKRAPLFTLKGATMPAIHLEIGYGSNEQDRANLVLEEFQQIIVAAMTDGIAVFKQKEE